MNFALPLAGSITGRVRDNLGNPIPYASVNAYDSLSFYYGYGDQNGNYSISDLSAGKYYVRASAYGYIEQWFDHKATEQLAEKVSVVEETVTPGINFDLQRLSGISGTVVDDSSGLGMSSVFISAIRKSDGSFWNSAWTNYDGTYFMPLPADDYIVHAEPYGTEYLREYYTSSGGTPLIQDAQTITVIDGQPARVLHFRLERRRNFYAFTREKLGMTITNYGQLGYWQEPTLPSGRWPFSSSRNYLFEGDIWVGGEVYNMPNVVGGMYQGLQGGWAAAWNYSVEASTNSQKVQTYYRVDYHPAFLGLAVRQKSYSWTDADYAIYKYTIFYGPSYGAMPNIQNAYIGFFLDFDISANAINDLVGIDKNNNLVYMYNSSAPDSVTMGVSLVSGSTARLTWWKNGNDPRTDTLRYGKMVADTSSAVPSAPDDYRVFVSAGPFNLVGGDSVSVAIAVVAGHGVAGVSSALQQAQAAYLTTSVEKSLSASIPENFVLHQNYPNPFNPMTVISFDLPKESHVKLTVYNVLGQEVITLVDEVRKPGVYSLHWNASSFPTGMYVYRITAGEFVQTKKMLLIK
ncbi:MAG: carboxypeptidase regulatory-like domain-containing protein [Ignavibacteriales bacterium]|nr:carboxypeptidase regulatory-like domain-containing protein [Ignavibacteriales bacterium]